MSAESAARVCAHDRAMDEAEAGDRALAAGDTEAAHAHYVVALDLERAVAESEHTQPSRAIMIRSAAWLALMVGDRREASRLAWLGIADDDTPDRLWGELLDVCEAAAGADTELALGPAAYHGGQAQPAPAMPEASTSGRLDPRSVGRPGAKCPTGEALGRAEGATGAARVRSASPMPSRASEPADTTSEEAPAVLPAPNPPSTAAGDGVAPRAEAGPMEGGAPLHVGDESPGRVAAPEHQDEPPAAPAGETETRNSERAPTPARVLIGAHP